MADSKSPAWQHAAQSNTESSSGSTLDQARKFLDDETVRASRLEKKTEFLKSKGLSDEDIQKLLSETPRPETDLEARTEVTPEASSEAKEHAEEPTSHKESPPEPEPKAVVSASPSPPRSSGAPVERQPVSPSPSSDAPPIITYPEFLTHSPRPPPLLTPTRLLNILSISGTAWTLLYGAARFVVSPMVDTLNESRSDYYTHVNTKMSDFVEKLEGVVSEVPYKNGRPLKPTETEVDDNSSYGDPTELFHRDVGTQTSPLSSLILSGSAKASEAPIDKQARHLARLTSSLRELSDMYTKKSEDTADLQSSLREIRDDVDKLGYPPLSDYTSYGASSHPYNADDEFKKTKDAIRGVKGIFLSSRMFPTATR